jgi:hypothetical protein
MRNRSLYLVVFFLAASISVRAQIQIGVVKGTVSDQTGALLVGVKITLSNAVTGYRNSATTDRDDDFTFDNLPFGSYTLSADATGSDHLLKTSVLTRTSPSLST